MVHTGVNADINSGAGVDKFSKCRTGYSKEKFSNETVESIKTKHVPLNALCRTTFLTYASQNRIGRIDDSVYDAINRHATVQECQTFHQNRNRKSRKNETISS